MTLATPITVTVDVGRPISHTQPQAINAGITKLVYTIDGLDTIQRIKDAGFGDYLSEYHTVYLPVPSEHRGKLGFSSSLESQNLEVLDGVLTIDYNLKNPSPVSVYVFDAVSQNHTATLDKDSIKQSLLSHLQANLDGRLHILSSNFENQKNDRISALPDRLSDFWQVYYNGIDKSDYLQQLSDKVQEHEQNYKKVLDMPDSLDDYAAQDYPHDHEWANAYDALSYQVYGINLKGRQDKDEWLAYRTELDDARTRHLAWAEKVKAIVNEPAPTTNDEIQEIERKIAELEELFA